MQIQGLMWDKNKNELIIKKMPCPAKVHNNGFFYHEDCLKEKLHINASHPGALKK